MPDPVTDYAIRCLNDDVTIGKFEHVKMGRLHKLACKRHLDDLEKSKDPDYPYEWRPEKAQKILDFASMLTLKEGFEHKPLQLLDCQKFDLGCRIGWVKKKNGFCRFRRSYYSVARQNGKSMQNGILGPYKAACSGYEEGLLFTAATKKKQAKIAWNEMRKFIEADPDLSELFDIKEYKSEIRCIPTNCTIRALSKEEGLDDGFRSIFSSLDELHQLKDNSVYEALYKGTKALPETLLSMISTRGKDRNSFAKEIDDLAVQILEGLSDLPDFFADIYCIDAEDDWWDERTWVKANPFICSQEFLFDNLKADAATAKAMQGSTLRDFAVKTLNIWMEDEDRQFIKTDQWKACAAEETIEDYAGSKCWGGLDLSSGGDLTTVHLEIEGNRKGQSFNWSHSFMPRGRMDEHIKTDVAPYDVWEKEGLLTVTGGSMDFKNDYKFIISKLRETLERYDLRLQGIGIDPHNADGILADLEAFGVPVVMVTQSAKSLNDATCEIQLDIKSGGYHYNSGAHLLSWSFTNAAVVGNSFGEIKVDKEVGKRNRRIDPVDAAVDARACRLKLAPRKRLQSIRKSIYSGISKRWDGRDMNFWKRVKYAVRHGPKYLFKSSWNQTDSWVSLANFLGMDAAMDRDAMSEATYMTCLKVLGETMGKLPLKLFKRNDKGEQLECYDRPLYRTLNERPNPYMSASVFWGTVELLRNHYGNAYVLITGVGDSQKLWILDPTAVTIRYDDSKLLSETNAIWYQYSRGSERMMLHSDMVLHFKTSTTFDGIQGKPIRQILADTVLSAKKAQTLLNKLYSSGFTAKMALKYTGDLNDATEINLLQHIEKYARGELASEGIENILPLPIGTDLVPLNIKLTDAQYLEIKQYTATQIAAAMGIKPQQIGDYSKSSYASAEAQSVAYLVDTLLFIVKQYEEELSYKLLSDDEWKAGYFVKFNIDVILRADFSTKIQALSTAVNSFLMTPNEARRRLDLGGVDGGDKLLGNGASIPVGLTGAQYTQSTEVPK